MVKGKVYMINPDKGWVAILTENNTFSIVEILEMTLPELGDIVQGDLESLGEETLYNINQQEEIDVFIQDIYADEKNARMQLRAPI